MRRKQGDGRTRTREAGETLVETLVSIALLGIIAVGVVGSLGAELIASARDRDKATTESVVRSFAAWVDAHVGATTATYHPCTSGAANPYYGNGTGQWTSANLGYTPPSGFTASVLRWGATLAWGSNPTGGVGYWRADSTTLAGNPQPSCQGTDSLLQLTLRVSTSNGAGTQTSDVVVRKP